MTEISVLNILINLILFEILFTYNQFNNNYYMKKIGKATCFTLTFSFVIILNFTIPIENIYLNYNSNIEALADVEDNKFSCMGVGSIDCPVSTEKVKYVR